MAWDEDDDGVDHCLTQIEPHLPKTGKVLDIGCGVGRLTGPLAVRNPQLQFVGSDTSVQMISLARRRWTLPNLDFAASSWVPADIAFAFSVVTFQHMSDGDMIWYLRVVASIGAPIVFQFVAGTEREPLSMQRDELKVCDWCHIAGFSRVTMTRDERFPNWRWVYAR